MKTIRMLVPAVLLLSTIALGQEVARESGFACDRSALTAADRKRHFDELGPALRGNGHERRELRDGCEFHSRPCDFPPNGRPANTSVARSSISPGFPHAIALANQRPQIPREEEPSSAGRICQAATPQRQIAHAREGPSHVSLNALARQERSSRNSQPSAAPHCAICDCGGLKLTPP